MWSRLQHIQREQALDDEAPGVLTNGNTSGSSAVRDAEQLLMRRSARDFRPAAEATRPNLSTMTESKQPLGPQQQLEASMKSMSDQDIAQWEGWIEVESEPVGPPIYPHQHLMLTNLGLPGRHHGPARRQRRQGRRGHVHG
jgi:hypothetical protein